MVSGHFFLLTIMAVNIFKRSSVQSNPAVVIVLLRDYPLPTDHYPLSQSLLLYSDNNDGDLAFRVWQSPNPAANETPLLIAGQTVTNGIGGVSWNTGLTAHVYLQAVEPGTATLVYSFYGTGEAEGIVSRASMKLTAFEVDLDVDTNGDGVINQDDDFLEDVIGGLISFNCDDDLNSLEGDGVDCEDAIVNGVEDVKDLAKLLQNAIPELPGQLKLVLEISEYAADKIRIFSDRSSDASMILGRNDLGLVTRYEVPPPYNTHVYGVEATCFADADYDGTTFVTQKIERADGTVLASDVVKLRVAPFILSDSTLPLEAVYVSDADPKFVADLKDAVGAGRVIEVSAAKYGVLDGNIWHPDVWIQDEVEIGHTLMPSGGMMPVVLDLPRNRGLDDWPKDVLRRPNFGYFAKGNTGSSANYGGNLECTPPFTKDGIEYPYGRAVISTSMESELVDFINAQGIQAPAIALDMSWLDVGHVDEIFTFVPHDDGFKVLVADTRSALSLLEEMNLDAAGLATGGGTTTLTDTNSLWTSGQWAGGTVRIVSGTGSNQIRQISGNTSDTLAVSRPWTVQPGTNSKYQVIAHSAYLCLFVEGNEDVGVASSCTTNSLTDSTKNWLPDCWTGGAVAIVSGDWQYHYAIKGNSADTLYLEDIWDTAFPPTDSSVYVAVTDPKVGTPDWSFPQGRPLSRTVRQFLEHYRGNRVNVLYNENCQTNIDFAVTTLSQELGLVEDDFVRIPSLFRAGDAGGAVSHVPSMVNLLVDGGNLIIADPFGPRKNGDDAFKADVREKLPGFTIFFIDDWDMYHMDIGGVHCGTNARRMPRSHD